MAEARKGKIARLPLKLRLQVNRRLRDGETGAAICRWLNGRTDVQALMAEQFGGEPVKAQNLSEWRAGGYRDWLDEEESVEKVRRLADYAYSLAKASGGNLSEGAAAVAGGKLLQLLEAAKDDAIVPASLAIAKLRDSDARVAGARVLKARLAQKERELAIVEAKFQRETAKLFLQWFENEQARRIAESGEKPAVKMDRLIGLMFGPRPDPAP